MFFRNLIGSLLIAVVAGSVWTLFCVIVFNLPQEIAGLFAMLLGIKFLLFLMVSPFPCAMIEWIETNYPFRPWFNVIG